MRTKKPDMIAIADENNAAVRECPQCHNWISLLGVRDEHGNLRSYNHQPASKGLCTCHLGHS